MTTSTADESPLEQLLQGNYSFDKILGNGSICLGYSPGMQSLPKRARLANNKRSLLDVQKAPANGDDLRRLGLDLHNSIVQSLAALTANLDVVTNGGHTLDLRMHNILEQSSSIARECFQQLLTLSEILCPQVSDEAGLLSDTAPESNAAGAKRQLR